MSIKVGDKIPAMELGIMGEEGPSRIHTHRIFKRKKVVLFALPGAYTPTCSAAHLPGFVIHGEEILAKGVDTIACLAVNDPYVMDAWGREQNVGDRILMLADGNAEFTEAVGLGIDRTASHMGYRSQRYAMIVENGVLTHLNLEVPFEFEVSDAETILGLL